jgi:hypothetical protein
MKRRLYFAAAVLCVGLLQNASAAQGEMGTGTPHFGVYTESFGGAAIVWSLANATLGFPAGCTYLYVSPASLGSGTFRIAIATMLTAKTTGKKVRFYSHAPRDGGCGVDYVELVD